MRFETLSSIDNAIGGPLCRLLVPAAAGTETSAPPGPPRHALVVKLRGIGDIILALPMLRALKDHGARITFVTGPANGAWLSAQGLIDDLLVVDFQRVWRSPRLVSLLRRLRGLGADACIDLTQSAHFPALLGLASRAPVRVGFVNRDPGKRQRNRLHTHAIPFSGHEHMAACFFDLLGPFSIPRPEPLRLVAPMFSRADDDAVSSILERAECGGAPLVGIHAMGSIPAKRWPLAGWVEVCAGLMARGFAVVAVGGAREKEDVGRLAAALGPDPRRFVNAAGRLSLTQLFALMPRLRFFIANDGGPMHVAAAAGVPTLGLFGPEVPWRYSPLNDASLWLYGGEGLACSPCSRPYEGAWPTCRRPVCMEAIAVDEVRRAVDELERRSAALDRDH